MNVSNVTGCVVSNLATGTTYYFAVYAYGAGSLQSELSNEVSWRDDSAPSRPHKPTPIKR